MKTRILKIINTFEAGNKARFGKKLGAKSGLIGNWVTGRANPGADYRNAICREYKINRDWLDTGQGEMLLSNQSQPIQHHEDTPAKKYDDKDLENAILRARLEDSQKLNRDYLDRIESALKACSDSQKKSATTQGDNISLVNADKNSK